MSTCARIVFAAFLALLCGCNAQKEKPALEVFEQKYPVDSDAIIRIMNPHGSIAVRGNDSTEVQLHATKIAGSTEQLKNISVSVIAQNNDLLIKTNFVRPKGKAFLSNGDRVDYELSIPRTLKIMRLDVDDGRVFVDSVKTSELRANVVDGQMELRNCSGKINIGVQNGDLTLFDDTGKTQTSSTEARVLHGTLTISVPRNAGFRIRAETTDGNITSAFAQTVDIKGGPLRKIDISSGAAPRSEIQLEVKSGNIIIADASADARTGNGSASR